MSRSRKKNPFSSLACLGSKSKLEAFYKRNARRKLRFRQNREIREYNEIITTDSREMSNCWGWPKDGRARFDGDKHPEWMRK